MSVAKNEERTVIEERLNKILDWIELRENEIVCPVEMFDADFDEVPWCCEDYCVWQDDDECVKNWLKGKKQ